MDSDNTGNTRASGPTRTSERASPDQRKPWTRPRLEKIVIDRTNAKGSYTLDGGTTRNNS